MKNKILCLIFGMAAIVVLAATVNPGHRIRDYWYVGSAGMDDSDITIFERTNSVPNTNVILFWVDIKSAVTNLTTNVLTSTITNFVGNLPITNVVRLRTLIPSTTTTQQIDFVTGTTAYYWTNMVTNVVVQLTNLWTAEVTNRVVNFFFTGATNNGPNYTVTFTCPNPGGVAFRWGVFSSTNGLTSLSVTNNRGAGVSLTAWATNVIEGYFSPVL